MAEPQSAAKKALQKLEDQLQCAICLDPYKDPKLLQCFHVFCKKCLERLVIKDRQGQLSARCPTCRRSTLLPASGVSSLEPAFHINHLFEIQEALEKVKEPQKVQCEKCTKTSRVATSFCHDCGKFICAKCVETHTEWNDLSSHEVVSIENIQSNMTQLVPPKKVTLFCSKHKGMKLKLYCETCSEMICGDCTFRLHQGHQYDLINDTFEKHKTEFTASLEPVETQLGTVNKALQQLDTRCEQIIDQREAIEAEIHQAIQRLHQALDARKTELIGQLDHMTQQKLKNLAAQRDEVETIQTQLNSCLEFVRESLRTGSQGEVMKMKKPVMKQIKEMTADFKPDTLEPSEEANIKFAILTNVVQTCQQFGTVSLQQVSPEKCYATGKGLESALVGEKATAILHTVDTSGKAPTIPVESVNCELSIEFNPKCEIKQLKGNQHEISYHPTTRGRHQLHIKVEGEYIKGSPFTVMVKLPVQKLGTPIKTIGGLNTPWGVAVNKRGEIIVAEYGNHCVSIFSPNGEKLRSFGSYGSGEEQFNYPQGVAVDDDDNILVIDKGNHRILKCRAIDGLLIMAVGGKGNGLLEFYEPFGVSTYPHTKMVHVADRNNHRIQTFNPDLTFSNSFGSRGSGNEQFQYPSDVAVDNTGNVYVADSVNHRVQVFTADGQFLRKFGKRGQGDEELDYPSGIAIDSDNVVYVTEFNNHRVSVFTCEGQFLTSFGTKGNEPGQFKHPCGITVDKSGVVYVSDHNGVQLF